MFFEPGRIHGGTMQSQEQVSFYWFHFHGQLSPLFTGKKAPLSERDRVKLQCRYPTGGTIRFSEICEWIRMNAEKPLISTDVASRFGYHEDYLAKLFRKNLQCSMKCCISKFVYKDSVKFKDQLQITFRKTCI